MTDWGVKVKEPHVPALDVRWCGARGSFPASFNSYCQYSDFCNYFSP